MSNKLGPLLLQAGVLTPQQLRDGLEVARSRNVSLLDVIVEEKLVPEESLAETFAQWLKLPRVRLASAIPEPEAIKAIGEELVRKHVCLPVKIEGQSLVLAMANPLDYDAIQDIQFASGLRVRPLVGSRTEILDAIEQHYATEDQIEEFLSSISDTPEFSILAEESEEADLEGAGARGAAELPPVIKMCNLIIRDAVKSQASDVHIEPRLNKVQVRLRVDGVLRDYMQVPKWLNGPVVSRLKILANLDIAERRVPQDGRIKVQFEARPLDIRISTLPTHFGEKVVMRVLSSATISTFQGLGFSEADGAVLESALKQPEGMILVTGPTGSGKSTTLYSMIAKRKSPQINITTVEDPIEYQLPGINQVQVNIKAGLTFAACLRSILRQDPDVILVGEIRDRETADIAIRSAMTGHLVLTTLHTNSSLATIGRLLELGIDPFLLTSSIHLIMAQRLVRRICLGCKEPYTPPAEMLGRLRLGGDGMVFYRGRGCAVCGQTGFSGRVGVVEVVRMTPTLKEMILRKAGEAALNKTAAMAGTRFLLEDAVEKVRQGLTTVEEVLRVIQLKEEEVVHCPNCSAFIHFDFSTCPYCLFPLKHLCASCGQELRLEWKICPYCNTRRAPQAVPEGARESGAANRAEERIESKPESPETPGKAALQPFAAAPEKPRILVVDDDEATRRVIQKALLHLPIEAEVATAADGVEALEAIGRQLPDLVISDVMMPRMDGFTLCERLRQDIRTAFLPIMMLTANTDEADRTKGYLVGTDDYVSKPFSVPELNARVMRLLRRTYGL